MNHPEGTFKLESKVAPGVKYAAVSYRWGSPSAQDCYMLTGHTAGSMQKGVTVKALPKTILEACEIAHRLGLEYVWIDRLCIFQDSADDWSQEASKMALIYKHAFITVAASCASDESQGCFRKRNAAGIQPLWLFCNPLVPSRPIDTVRESFFIVNKCDQGKLGHLAHRGWVFQERILSQRSVRFAEYEVHWECKQLHASEAWPDGSSLCGLFDALRPSIDYYNRLNTRPYYPPWHTLVHHYSLCQLTWEKDKLPAMSGLAREIMDLRKNADDAKDEYLAGLWQSTLLLDLFWSVDDDTAKTPEEYMAPSWSWAGLHAKVSFLDRNPAYGYQAVAKFRKAQLEFVTADVCGAVDDGYIQLFGHLGPVMVNQRRTFADNVTDWPPHDSWSAAIRGADAKILPFSISAVGKVDIGARFFDKKVSKSAFCVPVLTHSYPNHDPGTDSGPEVYCLLLVPYGSISRLGGALPSPKTTNMNEFQRVGLASLRARSWSKFQAWLDKSPERDIIIR